jgi:hypothetical protein
MNHALKKRSTMKETAFWRETAKNYVSLIAIKTQRGAPFGLIETPSFLPPSKALFADRLPP